MAARVAELLAAGTPASEIAVLFRINAQSEVFEEALAEAGIPYVLRGAERFFERPEVREALVLLRGAARAAADDDRDGGAGEDGEGPASPLADDVRAVLGAAGWTVRPPSGSGAVRDRWESLNALVGLAEEMAAADRAAGLAELVAELAERAAAQHAPTVEGVTLASLHAAKGLEWDAVFLVGLVDGTLPDLVRHHPRGRRGGAAAALRRGHPGARTRTPVLGVGPFARRPGEPPAVPVPGRAAPRRPCRTCRASGGGRSLRSPGPSGPAAHGLRRVRGPARRGGRPHRGRCADCPPAYDEQVFERLRAWRLERAQHDSVPAYVVFTDATLEAVAERGPSTLAELSTINGVGAVKLDRYGADLLALLHPGDAGADSPGKEVASGS